jgi:predicted RNase H-like HicB family nuclease
MNKIRRKKLNNIIEGLSSVQDKGNFYTLMNTLDYIKDEEEDYYSNIPENLQYSQRAENSEQAIENLEEALDLLNEVYDMDEFDKNSNLIQQAIDKIEEAKW